MRLEFDGKQHIYGFHLTVPISPLIPDRDKSVLSEDSDGNSGNLIIHGDNLRALKALMPRYAGAVKCIYIDPPYNTGNEDWVYNDNVDSPLMRKWFEDHKPVDGEDMDRHDKWACMMWPRLHLLRDLLSTDGAIFVSVDDNEYHHCRMIMDEIFGPQNYIASFVWEGTGKNDAKFVSVGHDYILCYARDFTLLKQNTKRWRVLKDGVDEINAAAISFVQEQNGDYYAASEQLKSWFGSLDKKHASYKHRHYRWIDERGVYFPGDISWPGGGGPKYDIMHPVTDLPVKVPAGGWRFSEKTTMLEAIGDDRVHFGLDESRVPNIKRYLNETDSQVLTSVFYQDRRAAHKDLKRILPEHPFDYPKDVGVISRLLEVMTAEDDIVLDSFAGSGTTAHAVLALNAMDDGNRKFVLVECEDYADTITAERVRRIMSGVPAAQEEKVREGFGGSFAFCKLGNPLDVGAMLSGDTLPPYRDMAAYAYYTATGKAINLADVQDSGDGPFYSANDMGEAFWLLYRPDLEWLQSRASALSPEIAEEIATSGFSRSVVFASHKLLPQRRLTAMGIVFCQLPYDRAV